MQPRNRLATVYLVAAGGLFLGVMLLQGYLWPPPTPPRKATTPDVVGLYAGALATAGLDKDVDVFGKAEEDRKQQYPSALGTLGGAATTVAVGIDAPAQAAEERREAQ